MAFTEESVGFNVPRGFPSVNEYESTDDISVSGMLGVRGAERVK
jgi:hypothetical protein